MHRTKMHFRKINKINEVFIEAPIDGDENGNHISLIDIFKDSVNIEDLAELQSDLRKLYYYINAELDLRERQIICMRYGLVRPCEGVVKAKKAMTQQEVAKCLKISRSYVSRIEKKAIEKLKARFGKQS